jgi:hypothetical protein
LELDGDFLAMSSTVRRQLMMEALLIFLLQTVRLKESHHFITAIALSFFKLLRISSAHCIAASVSEHKRLLLYVFQG